MDAVAHQAGMSKKTIYRHFRSQFELLATMLAQAAAEMAEPPAPTSGAAVEGELVALMIRVVNQMTSARSVALARLIIAEVRRYPGLLQHSRQSFPRRVIAQFLAQPVVSAHYRIGDPDDAAAMLLGMVLQESFFRLLLADFPPLPPDAVETRVRRAVSIFLRGVSRDR